MTQLRPGVSGDQAIKALEELARGSLTNLWNQVPAQTDMALPGTMLRLVVQYDQWTTSAAHDLAKIFLDGSAAARLREGRYDHIVGRVGDPFGQARLLGTELSELHGYFTVDAPNEFRELQARFQRHRGRTLVLDCNDLLHYQRFDKIPWARLYGVGVVVVLPHVIVDEIDTTAYNNASDKMRTRARGVYRLLEQLQDEIDDKGYADLKDGATLEILADDLGHQRVNNNDNETVARAAYLQQALDPGKVTVITRDIGMRARARTWKLRAEPLSPKYLIPSDALSVADLDMAVETITVRHTQDQADPEV
ncbi:PIN domain-containing protein [Streptomyces sp. SLBN-115]|uniref:PIN domain-containing protein n=1 Tax=Streptomyces sp. SLBN-115 TaxID=2768453 RepID=UPI00114E1090|nr:PIN domain-containing protein [Streptomyces sp. SLBN-115]TQJ55969.1 PIN domain-containing protein [Streptomyces sp. SLBN-115]